MFFFYYNFNEIYKMNEVEFGINNKICDYNLHLTSQSLIVLNLTVNQSAVQNHFRFLLESSSS